MAVTHCVVDAEFRESLRSGVPDVVGRGDESPSSLAHPTFQNLLARCQATICLVRVQTIHFVLAIRNHRHETLATWSKVFVAMQLNVRVLVEDAV